MEERRREDQELARWRGSIDARVNALDRQVAELTSATHDIGLSLTRVQGTLDDVQHDVAGLGGEIRGAAEKIDQGREDAVKELKERYAAGERKHEQALSQGRLSREQKWLVVFAAVATPAISTFLTIIFTGGVH